MREFQFSESHLRQPPTADLIDIVKFREQQHLFETSQIEKSKSHTFKLN